MKTRNFLVLLRELSVLGLLLFILTTCKEDSKDDPITEDQIVIAPTAKFILSDDWNTMIKSIDSSNFTITSNQTLVNNYSLVPGDLIVSSEGNGILRKIDAINNSGNDIIIITSQATLVDLIKQGTIDFKTTLTKANIKSIQYYYPGITLNKEDLKSTADNLFKWDINAEIAPQIFINGNFQYSSLFSLKIRISPIEGINEVKFGFEESENINLSLVAGNEFSLKEEITLASVYFNPILIPLNVPPFAIVVTPVFDIKIGANGFANANISTTLNQNLKINASVQYLKGNGWSSDLNWDKSFDFTPPDLNLNAGATVFVKPEIKMLIFNVVGPYVNEMFYGKINADLEQDPWWKMYYGRKISAGAKAQILDNLLFDFSVDDLLSSEELVGQAMSLNGVWDRDVIEVTISGSSGVFSEINSGIWLNALNLGFISLGSQKFSNITRTSDLNWTCDQLWAKYDSLGNTTSVFWDNNNFIKMSPDGSSITLTSPLNPGAPSSSVTYIRKN